MSPTASGRLEGDTLVFLRTLPLSREEAWAALTDPDRTARWIGPWSGDPASGTIELTMTEEEGDPVSGVRVEECLAPERLVVVTGPGEEGWRLTVTVRAAGEGSVLELRQRVTDPGAASFIGPGWDFYLDRLVAAETGGDPAACVFAPDYHPGLAEHYSGLYA